MPEFGQCGRQKIGSQATPGLRWNTPRPRPSYPTVFGRYRRIATDRRHCRTHREYRGCGRRPPIRSSKG